MVTRSFDVPPKAGGYHNSEVVPQTYLRLKEALKLDEPIATPAAPAITVQSPNWRGVQYTWELYRSGDVILMFEAMRGGGYASQWQRSGFTGDSYGRDGGMRVTIDGLDLSRIESIIESTIDSTRKQVARRTRQKIAAERAQRAEAKTV